MLDNTKTYIVGGTILTMDTNFTIYENGLIIIDGEKLEYVGPYTELLVPKDTNATIIDAHQNIIIPGLINTHTHSGMSLFRSLADDKANRLKEVIFPLEQSILNEEIVYWASLNSISEMIRGGTTCFADMYYFSQYTAKAATQAQIRALVGQSITSSSAPDAVSIDEGFDSLKNLINEYSKYPLLTPSIAPHAPYSLKLQDHKRVALCAHDYNIPILSHLSEMPFEEQYTLEKFNAKPISFYASMGLLNQKSTMAHLIFADKEERIIVINNQCGVAHNVSANSKSGKGIAPAFEFYHENARIGLGTDGPMSGNTLDIIGQLHVVAKMQKLHHKNPTIMKSEEVLAMATIGGARALHMEKKIGSLEKGKLADIAIISTAAPSMYPIYNYYSAIVYSAIASDVDSVFISGKCVMKNKKVLSIDESAVRDATAHYVKKIRNDFSHIIY
jgi:cytosine/adenosine deaminase-related metal-dependent hydrolase